MAATVQELLDNVRVEGGFDATEAQALQWLNRRWQTMVTEALAYRKVVAVGTTVAGQGFYPFAPVKAFSFEVDGVPYGKGRRPDIYADSQGGLWLSGDGGVIVAGADATGARGITLVPSPSAGQAITSFAAVAPPALTNDASGNTLLLAVLEDQFSDELAAGAMATGLRRLRRRPDLSVAYEQEFAAGTERLRVRTRQRFRGQGPAQIRIVGVNA
jgi:hypothetical protein